ncbi:MAG: hypothetical protein A2Y87_05970, partial [Bacteroidetes bacterium RBG_13_46_8]
YGRLYNWETLHATNICPARWHVPTDADWTILTINLGGDSIAGRKLKEAGNAHWIEPNTGGTNESGFTGLPGGYRTLDGEFRYLGNSSFFWSSVEADADNAWYLALNVHDYAYRSDAYKSRAFSVRCIYDATPVAYGNTFIPDSTEPGSYLFYAIQTVLGCESPPDTVRLTISRFPAAPLAENVTGCEGKPVPDLAAEGTGIQWYSDPAMPIYDTRDGQEYKTVTIGNQTWMAENLNYYTTGGSWYYNNDSTTYADTYGRLYDWGSAKIVCPAGWQLPSDGDWMQLVNYLGGNPVAGGKMKEADTIHWKSPNTGATNEREFTALPGGYRLSDNQFTGLGTMARFWTSTKYGLPGVYYYSMYYNNTGIYRYYTSSSAGSSVRCIYSGKPFASGNSYTHQRTDTGTYTFFATQTVLGCESPADTILLTINPGTAAPHTGDVTICEGEPVPDLVAEGTNIRWYSDAALIHLVHSGDSLSTGLYQPGGYTFYATQTEKDCESPADTVLLIIRPAPEPPLAENVNVCDGDLVPDLSAQGDNVKWYSDTVLSNLVHTGNSYATGITEPGMYVFYVTQTLSGCESEGIPARLTIYSLPVVYLGDDTTINTQQNITLGFNNEDYTFLWSNGSESSSIVISGSEAGVGDHTCWLKVTDSNSCSNADTIRVTVVDLSDVPVIKAGNALRIRPNPVRNTLYVDFTDIDPGDFIIRIIDQQGREVRLEKDQ